MNVVTILQKAKARIKDVDHWGKTQFAFDSQGSGVSYNSPLACAFCSYGAVLRELWEAYGDDHISGYEAEAIDLLNKAANELYKVDNIVLLNDRSDTTLEMVHAAFDRAIEHAEAAA